MARCAWVIVRCTNTGSPHVTSAASLPANTYTGRWEATPVWTYPFSHSGCVRAFLRFTRHQGHTHLLRAPSVCVCVYASKPMPYLPSRLHVRINAKICAAQHGATNTNMRLYWATHTYALRCAGVIFGKLLPRNAAGRKHPGRTLRTQGTCADLRWRVF